MSRTPPPATPPATPSTATGPVNLGEIQKQVIAELQEAEQELEEASARVWRLRGQLEMIGKLTQQIQQQGAPPAQS